MTATVHVGEFVHRSCSQHSSFATRAADPKGCPRCRENAKNRARHARDLVTAGLVCAKCKTRLLRPAALCGFCDPAFDLDAALHALDNKGAGGDVTRPGAVTHGRNP
jgi:hypothetical protein